MVNPPADLRAYLDHLSAAGEVVQVELQHHVLANWASDGFPADLTLQRPGHLFGTAAREQ